MATRIIHINVHSGQINISSETECGLYASCKGFVIFTSLLFQEVDAIIKGFGYSVTAVFLNFFDRLCHIVLVVLVNFVEKILIETIAGAHEIQFAQFVYQVEELHYMFSS